MFVFCVRVRFFFVEEKRKKKKEKKEKKRKRERKREKEIGSQIVCQAAFVEEPKEEEELEKPGFVLFIFNYEFVFFNSFCYHKIK